MGLDGIKINRNEIFKFNQVQAKRTITSENLKQTKFLCHYLYLYFVLGASIAWISNTKEVAIATAKVIAILFLKASLFEDSATANNTLCFNLSKILWESRDINIANIDIHKKYITLLDF